MAQRPVLLTPAARTGSGTGPVFDTGGNDEFHAGTFVLGVTAVSGNNPTLNVYVQVELPDLSWIDLVSFTQMAAGGKRIAITPPVVPGGVEAPITDAALTQGTVRGIPMGPRYRVKWVIGGTASPSFTFSVSADLFA